MEVNIVDHLPVTKEVLLLASIRLGHHLVGADNLTRSLTGLSFPDFGRFQYLEILYSITLDYSKTSRQCAPVLLQTPDTGLAEQLVLEAHMEVHYETTRGAG